MYFKKISKCRVCSSTKVNSVFDLANVPFTGKFPKSEKIKIPNSPLNLGMCNKCKFVQLMHRFNSKYMYNDEYGYESGVNSTMRNHLKKIVNKIKKLKKLDKKSVVMDIASNDGTLLNFYPKNVIKIGIDPILKRFKKNYKNIDYKISDFFSYKNFSKINLQKKVDVVTAFAVFYDIDNPNQFLRDIKKILKNDGILILEQSNLAKMINLNSFDTICQEHYGYYSTNVINLLLKKNNLTIFDLEYNDSNGGSSRYYIKHSENNKIKVNNKNIKKALNFENTLMLEKKSTYKKFYLRIKNIKAKCQKIIKKIQMQKKTIHGYGASTKGNVIINHFNINKNQMPFISDRNPFKNNRYTPGSKIKIISEKRSRFKNPDYYFVLPWHFKKEILIREKKMRAKGTKFIFPLPNFKIY